MSKLIRRVEMKKWPDDGKTYASIADIPADPISRDMNSRLNTFSLWNFDKSDYLEAGLTIALGLNQIDTIQIVFLEEHEILKRKLVLNNNSGDTSYKAMKDKHYDIVDMNHEALGKIADMILNCINKGEYEDCLRDELLELLVKKIESNDIDYNDLNKAVKKQVDKLM